ncbi:hypothetical protein XB02_00855 [Pantoea ananatis]|nr:hypothetical protein XB02_00855 [Pantoea ananatis]
MIVRIHQDIALLRIVRIADANFMKDSEVVVVGRDLYHALNCMFHRQHLKSAWFMWFTEYSCTGAVRPFARFACRLERLFLNISELRLVHAGCRLFIAWNKNCKI